MNSNLREKYSTKEFERELKKLLLSIEKDAPLVLIQGGYGKNNLGDDALLLTISKKVKSILPNAQIIALCHFPQNVTMYYGIDAVYFSEKRALKLLFQSDLLIIGGGGIVNKINTYSGFHFFKIFDPKGKYLFITSLLTRLRAKKVIFYGVGMTSIPDKVVKFLMSITLNKVNLISVRDERSYQIVKSIRKKKKIFLMHDPALNYDVELLPKQLDDIKYITEGTKYIVFNIRSIYDESITNSVMEATIQTINSLTEKYPEYKIVLLPISMHPNKVLEDDYAILKKVYEKATCKERILLIEKYFHPSQTREIIRCASAVIMTRLHGLILTYDYQVPTVVLSYDNKVRCFAEMAEYEHIIYYESVTAEILKEALADLLVKKKGEA